MRNAVWGFWKRTFATKAIDAWGAAVDFAFPPECFGCHRSLPDRRHATSGQDSMWCDECERQLTSVAERCCPACGAEHFFARFPQGRCSLCRGMKLHFDRAICLGNYHGLMQELIVRLKGSHDEPLAVQLGRLLGRKLNRESPPIGCDLIIATPTHWWNHWQRPSFVAGIIAEGVSQELRRPAANHLLRCLRRTKKQGTLSTRQRIKNVEGAFAVTRPKLVAGRSILVVDDVITSGATVNQLAKILKRAGAAQVFVAALARGVRHVSA